MRKKQSTHFSMDSPTNPYASPQQTGQTSSAIKTPKWSLRLTLASTLVGALVTGIAVYLIFVNDPRSGTNNAPPLYFSVACGSLFSAVIWAVSGLLQRSVIGLLATFSVGASVAVLWRMIFGTYADVLGAAAVVGWPIGGFVTSVIQFPLRKWLRNRRSQSMSSAGRNVPADH